jgi:hypothetical protein
MNQHFITRFLIENFIDESAPGNRGVWVYRASRKKWEKRPASRTASLEDYYSFVEKNGERDDTLEDLMENIETKAAPIIRNTIEKGGRLAPPQPYDLFICFCALLICRNPATIERVKSTLALELVDEMKRDFGNQEAFQRLRADFKNDTGADFPNFVSPEELIGKFRFSATKAGGLGFSMMMLALLNEQLGRLHVRFLRAPTGRTFITSDSPYVIGSSASAEIEKLMVPLSPRTCAMFYPDIDSRYDYLSVDEETVDFVNQSVLNAAQEFVVAFSPDAVSEESLTKWVAAKLTVNQQSPT